MLSVPGEPALLPLYSSRHRALPWGSSRDGKSSEHYADVPRFLPYTEGPLPPETVVSHHFNSELISYTLILNCGREGLPGQKPRVVFGKIPNSQRRFGGPCHGIVP